MAAAQIITEIRPLTPEELSSLAEHLAQTDDPIEASRLSDSIVRGFYGAERMP